MESGGTVLYATGSSILAGWKISPRGEMIFFEYVSQTSLPLILSSGGLGGPAINTPIISESIQRQIIIGSRIAEKHGACWSVGDLPFIINELKSSRTRGGLYLASRGMHFIYINGIWGGNIFFLKNMVYLGLLGIYLLSLLN